MSDGRAQVPLDDETVDYINCGGVLQHTSHPETLLREFFRALRRGGRARIMVYNRHSLWFHLYTAYVKMIIENAFPGLSVDEAFSHNTDGERCPISRCYAPGQFVGMLQAAGFHAEFLGGYLSRHELTCLKDFGPTALADPRLAGEHREFMLRLRSDARGLPMYQDKHAGIGGVYSAVKA